MVCIYGCKLRDFSQCFITELEILERYIYKNVNLKKNNSGILFGALLKPEHRRLGYTAFNCYPIIAYFSYTRS